MPLPFQERETRPEALRMAPKFSFLRFPQSKGLWIPLLTLLGNPLLKLGHQSYLPLGFSRTHQQPSTDRRKEGDQKGTQNAKEQLVGLRP